MSLLEIGGNLINILFSLRIISHPHSLENMLHNVKQVLFRAEG
jgi:hypothetical protein